MLTRHINIEELINDLLGNVWPLRIRALSKALTFIENNPDRTQDLLDQIAAVVSSRGLTAGSRLDPAVKPRDDKHKPRDDKHKPRDDMHVVGFTGFPGAGKSTLVNLIVNKWRAQNKTVAVLAIDPSSSVTGGAVLGDRIRMQEHFKDDGVFIRSMGARGALGGLSQATHGAIELLKLLNFDRIIIETVGIGQSESDIVKVADTVVLILLPNTGDEIQFMKAGVIQLAHIFVINKSDLADPYHMIQELEDNPPQPNGWQPPVVSTSAINNNGIDELISQIERHQIYTTTGFRGQAPE